MKLVEGKVVIVTGGARGIGRRAVERFAQEGAKVLLWDFDAESGERTASELSEQGLEVSFQQVNVASWDNVEAAAKEGFERYGRLDVLVNNAGITRDASLLKMSPEAWQQVIDVNLTGVFHCTKAVSPYLVKQGSGRIINTSSVVGIYGNFGQTNYVAAKSGVIGMTKVWARELGRKGILVNAVAPGFIKTEMTDAVPQKVIDIMTSKTPVGRMGSPDDIANAYLFLASELSNFVNGTTLSVDGGLVL